MNRVLNAFEKKSIILALSEYNVINLVLQTNSFNEAYYDIFYKFEDTLFVIRLQFHNYNPLESNQVSKFLELCRFKLKYAFENSHFYFKYSAPLDANEIMLSYISISNDIDYLLHALHRFDIFSLNPYKPAFRIDDKFEPYLRSGYSVKDSFRLTYEELGLDIDYAIEAIESFKHELEIL